MRQAPAMSVYVDSDERLSSAALRGDGIHYNRRLPRTAIMREFAGP